MAGGLHRLPDQAALRGRQSERALSEEPRPGAGRKVTGKEEALLVATACRPACGPRP